MKSRVVTCAPLCRNRRPRGALELFPLPSLPFPRPAKQSIPPSIQLPAASGPYSTVAFGGQNESGFLLATSQGTLLCSFSPRSCDEPIEGRTGEHDDAQYSGDGEQRLERQTDGRQPMLSDWKSSTQLATLWFQRRLLPSWTEHSKGDEKENDSDSSTTQGESKLRERRVRVRDWELNSAARITIHSSTENQTTTTKKKQIKIKMQ